MALPINDGSLSDFYMVYQFIDHSTVQVLQIQIFSDDRRPVLNGGGFFLCLVHFVQKYVQPFSLGSPFMLVILHQ